METTKEEIYSYNFKFSWWNKNLLNLWLCLCSGTTGMFLTIDIEKLFLPLCKVFHLLRLLLYQEQLYKVLDYLKVMIWYI